MSEKKHFTQAEEDLISSEPDDSSGNEMEDLPPTYSSIFDEEPPAAFESNDTWNTPNTLSKFFLEIR